MEPIIPAGYKLTEVGVIPEDWDVKKLGDICHAIIDGTHYTPTYVSHGVPFYSVENVTNDNFTNTKFISLEAHSILSKRCKPLKGDILLTRIGSLGATKLIDWDVDASIYVSLALLKVNNHIDANYLYSYSKSRQFVVDVIKRSLVNATPQKINLGDIGLIPIPLPSTLTEQRAIASALSEVDDQLTTLDDLIAKKRDIKQGAMQRLLTGEERLPGFSGKWEVKRLGEIAEIVMGQSPSSTYYNIKGTGLPLIQGNADVLKRKTIVRIFTTEITKKCFTNDTIMSVRAPVGEISKAVFDACLGRGVCAIRYPNEYLYHYLISQETRWGKLSKGSTFDSVNSADVKALEIYFPSDVEEQQAIAQVLSEMDEEIAALEASRDKAALLKKGMMQDLLTGKVRLV